MTDQQQTRTILKDDSNSLAKRQVHPSPVSVVPTTTMFGSNFFEENPLLQEEEQQQQLRPTETLQDKASTTAENDSHEHAQQERGTNLVYRPPPSHVPSRSDTKQHPSAAASHDGPSSYYHQQGTHESNVAVHNEPNGRHHYHHPAPPPSFPPPHSHCAAAKPRGNIDDHEDDDGGYTNLDVLCEKGGRANQHMGNRVFLRLVQRNKELYRKLVKKQDKDMLIQSIILAIQQNGGRFRQRLSPSSAKWQTVSWERCYQKARQALREPDRKVHKAAVAANEAAAKKQAALRGSGIPATASTMRHGRDERKRSASTAAYSEANDRNELNTAAGSSRGHVHRHHSHLPATFAMDTAVTRPSRHDLLRDDNDDDGVQPPPIMRYPPSHQNHSYVHHSLETQRNRPHLHSYGYAPPSSAFEVIGPERGAKFENAASRRHKLPAPVSLSRASSSSGMGGSDSNVPPPPLMQRRETSDSMGLPLETLLERQDSLHLSHLLEVVDHQKRKEEEDGQEQDKDQQDEEAN